MVRCRCTIICQISLVVTRPVLVPVLVSSTGSGAAWVCSLSIRACLLVRTVVVGARFSDPSIHVPLRAWVVARGSGAPVGGPPFVVSSRSAHNKMMLYQNGIDHNLSIELRLEVPSVPYLTAIFENRFPHGHSRIVSRPVPETILVCICK
ncbi:hypothetical protein VN97_g13090 [Penicillium thymicola]|uniref:Uncharacterized protein n=1 Tax=Penicillium thymicola TaxID=293382 RepID=A0AAI9X1X0_PENTH|nr:hypothetical protein VN97_g13090 [Penicillium thymicola]